MQWQKEKLRLEFVSDFPHRRPYLLIFAAFESLCPAIPTYVHFAGKITLDKI